MDVGDLLCSTRGLGGGGLVYDHTIQISKP